MKHFPSYLFQRTNWHLEKWMSVEIIDELSSLFFLVCHKKLKNIITHSRKYVREDFLFRMSFAYLKVMNGIKNTWYIFIFFLILFSYFLFLFFYFFFSFKRRKYRIPKKFPLLAFVGSIYFRNNGTRFVRLSVSFVCLKINFEGVRTHKLEHEI